MIGAIMGDMIGSPYEFDMSNKTKEFPLFDRDSMFTDDSVMTVAVAEALMDAEGKSEDEIKSALAESMQEWGRRYPDAGYGGMFYQWLREKDPKPYGSFGNGSAMRVSSAGWLYDTLDETRHMARLTAEVTHNQSEGIKGAEAVASAIFLARNGSSKEEIKSYITEEFGYDLSRTCDEIRPGYHHVETCQGTVPEAVTAFLEGEDFEDVIRTAVSLGGDCDTLTCIAGSMAEAFYGVPDEMEVECRKRLPDDMLDVLDRFNDMRDGTDRKIPHDMFLDGNELIEEAIERYHKEKNDENLAAVLEAVRQRMHEDGHLIFPVNMNEEDEREFSFRGITTNDGKVWHAAFTSGEEYERGPSSQVLSYFIDSMLKNSLETKAAGFIINPWGKSFFLANELIEMIIKADDGVEYSVPDDDITAELLEDGSFLKRAAEICSRNRTQLNMIKLARILRDSWVWVPCNAIMSDRDSEEMTRIVNEAIESGDLESLKGYEFVTQDNTRMVPDILQNGDDFFFPVFTTIEEMGEYGNDFSKMQRHFLEAANLAVNNEKDVKGIVINAFSEPFVVPKEMFEIIKGLPSSLEEEDDEDDGLF